MTTITIPKEQKGALVPILKELKKVNAYLEKLLVIIPEESLKEYKSPSRIKNSYLKTIKDYPPEE
ncbi:MAG: hypothetical protein HZA37_00870 [Parcubacteria group bacterium]|nr:hypothetical protein [Parcubacteria group bacterium]